MQWHGCMQFSPRSGCMKWLHEVVFVWKWRHEVAAVLQLMRMKVDEVENVENVEKMDAIEVDGGHGK